MKDKNINNPTKYYIYTYIYVSWAATEHTVYCN